MAYTPEMRAARKSHIITGLPDTYGRGRIVGDYRRVALYGIDVLIAEKQHDFANCGDGTMTDDVIRQRQEITLQINALKDMKVMAASYGYDISKPAGSAHEAFQWLYFGYLAAIKTQNGAAMSVGRISTFLDIYVERDLENGVITETEAQELVDHIVMKFRMVKFARITSYQAAVLRRPRLGDAGSRRHWFGRPFHGHQERLSFPAHAGKHGPVSGTQHDRAVHLQAA